LQVAACSLRAAGCGLQVALLVAGCRLRVA
jgi:hypothetical protein